MELNWTELNWTDLIRAELNWTELNWLELNWTENKMGRTGSKSIPTFNMEKEKNSTQNQLLHSFLNNVPSLTVNICNNVLVKNIKFWYYQSFNWNESNKPPHSYADFYTLTKI